MVCGDVGMGGVRMKMAISNIAWDAGEDADVYVLMRKYGYTGLELSLIHI